MGRLSIIDLTHSLNEKGSLYPGLPLFSCSRLPIDACRVTQLSMVSHCGTHIDAPSHFIDDGQAIDQLDLSTLVSAAIVIDLNWKGPRETIVWEDLRSYEHEMNDSTIVLLSTGWSKYWGTPHYFDHPYLDGEAAMRIMRTGVRVLGLDTLSPDETTFGGEGDFAAHKAILGSGGIIAENLTNLGSLDKVGFFVSLLPLKIDGGDGSPVRAIAWKD